MFRSYAHFSVNHPLMHKTNLLLVLSIFVISCYQLLANESIEYAAGFIFVMLPLIVFSKASDYKRKYLGTDK